MQQTGNDVTETKLVKLWDRLAYSGFFAIYMGQLVGPQFGQMVRKIQDWQLNFDPESHLLFVQITSIYRKVWNWYQRWLWRNEKKKQINIRTTFSDVTFIPEIFCWNDPRSSVPFTLQPDFPETFVNGKQSQKEQDEKCPLFKHQLFGTNW